MALTENHHITDWVAECAALCRPEEVVWIDGSEAQLDALRREGFRTGELPGCVYHRSAVNDVARVEARTFICCEREADAGPTNNWMAPAEMREKLRGIFDGAMAGRTMYVIPYAMGIPGSPFAKYGVELTDSIHGDHDAGRQGDLRRHRRRQLHQGAPLQGGAGRGEALHRPLPAGQHHHVRQLRLRRKRPARQKVLCAAHRLLPRPRRGLARGAHADPRRPEPAGRGALCLRRVPVRLRQDEPRNAHPAGGLPRARLEMLVRRRRYRVAASRSGRSALGGEPGKRLFRRRTRHEREDEPQRPCEHAEKHHFHECCLKAGRHRMVGGTRQEPAEGCAQLARRAVGPRERRAGRASEQPIHRSSEKLPLHQPGVR